MKKNILFTTLILLVALSHTFAQQARKEVIVKNVRFDLDKAKREINIYYTVENIIPQDSVYISVHNKEKKTFKSTALTGNIGKNIMPGTDKKIIWDIMADSLKIDEDIAVTVAVKLARIPGPNEPKPPKPIKEKKNKINVMAISVFGVGLATGGYMIYNGLQQKNVAKQYYQAYIDNNWNQKLTVNDDAWLKMYSEGSIASADAMLAKARAKQRKANIMLYSGIGLIVVDAILTIPRFRSKVDKKVSFRPDYIPSSNTFVLGANFKF